MASVYDKALKRKDFSGIVDKEKKKVHEKVEDLERVGGREEGDVDSTSRKFFFSLVSLYTRGRVMLMCDFVGCRKV